MKDYDKILVDRRHLRHAAGIYATPPACTPRRRYLRHAAVLFAAEMCMCEIWVYVMYFANTKNFKFRAKAPGARRSSAATADCFRRQLIFAKSSTKGFFNRAK